MGLYTQVRSGRLREQARCQPAANEDIAGMSFVRLQNFRTLTDRGTETVPERTP